MVIYKNYRYLFVQKVVQLQFPQNTNNDPYSEEAERNPSSLKPGLILSFYRRAYFTNYPLLIDVIQIRRKCGCFIVVINKILVILTFICLWTANTFPNYNKMKRFFIYLFLQTLYMFQAFPPLIIRSTQLYIQLQVLLNNTAACRYRGWNGTHPRYHLAAVLFENTWSLYTVMCSWWWAEEAPETCRASVEMNKLRNGANFWL